MPLIQADNINRRQLFTVLMTAPILLLIPIFVTLGQQSKFDVDLPTVEDVRASLQMASALISKDRLSADEIRQIYFAEKKIGRCVWGVSERDSALYGSYRIGTPDYFSDRTVGEQCLLYIQKHRDRFKVVDDGWKGENNFWEPTRYWADQANRLYPNSMQAREIEFDLEFNEFIRRFNIVEDAKGKTCQEYHEEDIGKSLDAYLDVYTMEEINQWPAECEQVREEFIRGKSQLLQKYKNAPFTKILKDIDPTTIVVMHSVC